MTYMIIPSFGNNEDTGKKTGNHLLTRITRHGLPRIYLGQCRLG